MYLNSLLSIVGLLLLAPFAMAGGSGGFGLVRSGVAVPILVDPGDFPGVLRAARDLQADIHRVTGVMPGLGGGADRSVIIGTIGRSPLIDRLVREGKIDVSGVAGTWESFVRQVVKDPSPGIREALVIAGSDKRGTIFGIYDISEKIGVSAWYWWADVSVRHQSELTLPAARYFQASPKVKYRGIFINDEAPSLTNWVHEKFGNYNHAFYEHVFELLLRLKANYLWPAMWDNCFSEDDPLNPKLADEYGIVMGTSHVEPMMRADKEWNRLGLAEREWNFDTHAEELRKFWTEGIDRNKPYENIVTIAMRGKIDTPMTESANISLLERIVAAQRQIIAEHINPNVSEVPQLWALYKEVQEYYEKGMRVPDDVTLLWCDDNWGNIRRLPTPDEQKRSGGAGVYYHFDYVGGPRNYKWNNTNPLPKIWEQMNQAYVHGANRIWIVNVGSLKPKEFPIEYFLRLAWDPSKMPKEQIHDFTRRWTERQFGSRFAPEIADILERYTKYNGRRKPELLDPDTYSLVHYGEAERVLAEFNEIISKAEQVYDQLPLETRDAFYQLVLYPTKAAGIVNELYITTAKNRLYAKQGRASANAMAERAKTLFQADADESQTFHRLGSGRWNHIMDQTRIGYTYWQQPEHNNMPALASVTPPATSDLGLSIEGSEDAWPGDAGAASLLLFDALNRQTRWIELFRRGQLPVEYKVKASVEWVRLSRSKGRLGDDQRIFVSIDWDRAPSGTSDAEVLIRPSSGQAVKVNVQVFNPSTPRRETFKGFFEGDGYVSIEAEHFSANVPALDGPAKWERIPGYGRTLSGMTIFPMTAASHTDTKTAPCLEYKIYVFHPGSVHVDAILGPTLNFVPGRGLRYAVSFDGDTPQIVDAHAEYLSRAWEKSVSDSVLESKSSHILQEPGFHTLKFWMVDPGVVLEKIVVDCGGLKPSYLGPPESYHNSP